MRACVRSCVPACQRSVYTHTCKCECMRMCAHVLVQSPPCTSSYQTLIWFLHLPMASMHPLFSHTHIHTHARGWAGNGCARVCVRVSHACRLLVGNGCWGNEVGTCGFGYDEVRLEMEYQFGHSLYVIHKLITYDMCCFPVAFGLLKSAKS